MQFDKFSELRKLCVTIHGAELIERLIRLEDTCEHSTVSQTLQTWLSEFIYPEIKGKPQLLDFFSQEYLTGGFSRRLRSALRSLRNKWQWQENSVKEQCFSILWECFSQYAYDVRTEGKTQNKRIEAVEKAIKRLERESENFRLLNDPAKLASQLFKEFGGRYSEQLLKETIWAMQPYVDFNEDIDNEMFLLHQYAPDVYDNFTDVDKLQTCVECTQCPEALTDDERTAVKIELENLDGVGTKQQLCTKYGVNRETWRLRFQRAVKKLVECLSSL